MQPLTSAAISASVSGVSTTNGYSTRQSVASVTCETRDRPSNLMLSLAVKRRSARCVRPPQLGHLAKARVERLAPRARPLQQLAHQRVALGIGVRRAALSDLGQPVMQRVHQQAAALGVVQQVVLQVGIALHHPDVAQHLVQHAGRAAGAALFAQAVQHLPGARAQQPDHDLAVGERGVVVGNLAQARRVAVGRGHELVERCGCVHRDGQNVSQTTCHAAEREDVTAVQHVARLPPMETPLVSRPCGRSNPLSQRVRNIRAVTSRRTHETATFRRGPRGRFRAAGPGPDRDPVVAFHGRRHWANGSTTSPRTSTRARRNTRSCPPTRAATTNPCTAAIAAYPRRQRAAHPAGVRSGHRHHDGRQGRHRAGRQGDGRCRR